MKIIDIVDKESAVLSQAPKPSIAGETDILVKVSFSAIDTAFPMIATRSFSGSFLRDLKGKPLVPGWHFSGVVEEVGSNVSDLSKGDRVFGHLAYNSTNKQGSCAEHVVVLREECAKIPDSISSDVAAAVTVEALTALQMMRDYGEFTKEKKSILVIAAGGGVGVQAIQIAKYGLGAEIVHGVCSTKDVQKVQGLGADRVIDRTKTDILKDLEPGCYDVILELSGRYSFPSLKYALKPKGAVVTAIPNVTTLLFYWVVPYMFWGKKYRSLTVQSRRPDLELIADWLQQGKIKSVPIDSTHRAVDIMKAWELLEDPKKNGRIVIKVDGGW